MSITSRSSICPPGAHSLASVPAFLESKLLAYEEDRTTPCSMLRYKRVAARKLTEFLVFRIRDDPSFDDIFQHMEPAAMMRSASSILIGYWANEEAILPLVYAMGTRAFGVKRFGSGEACISNVKEKEHDLVPGEERPVNKICMESPSCTIIADLSQFPEAVLLAEELLESLKDAVPLRLPPYLHYLERHRSAALGFWFAPVIILHLIKELKEVFLVSSCLFLLKNHSIID
ncbi:unnamed protein product [Cuscuta europaea]|uniref:Uncharacterized protein n=1 Tax=Cuscuta europaea TaxID=41803 RepID=A0A9P0YKE7_CUSEU|nr:unnamed protein product [Cuscuta europaea]